MSVPVSTADATASRSAALAAEVAADPSAHRVLTGDRPTGALHLGHLFGSIQERVRLQDLGVDVWVVVADYQVITDRAAMGDVQRLVREQVLDYLAAGVDPERATVYAHSAVPAANQLVLPFLSLVSEAELHRNPTVKAELAASGRELSGLLLTYPVHQAADILSCRADLVPVGQDNVPHVEQTRVIARRFSERYGEVFPVPAPLVTATPVLPGLDGRKMSKSYGNAIALSMTADETADVIRRARTDGERRITYDPAARPGVSALLDTAAVCTGDDPRVLADRIGDGGSATLKRLTTDAVNGFLAGHRQRRADLARDTGIVHEVLTRGAQRANAVAEETLDRVRAAMGTVY